MTVEDRRHPNRRSFLRAGALASGAALVSGCLRGAQPSAGLGQAAGTGPKSGADGFARPELVPDRRTIYGWIEEIFEGGSRRPGYPADRRAEEICVKRFRELGLDNVRLEPVELSTWEPRSWSLRVRSAAAELELPCYPLPHTAPTEGLDGELVAVDRENPDRVHGKVALAENRLLRMPPDFPVKALSASETDPDLALRLNPSGRIYDTRSTFENAVQILPFGPLIQGVMEPSIEAGAIGFIGALPGYPGESIEYYVPYDGIYRNIPAVWISGGNGERLQELLDGGPVHVTILVDSSHKTVTSHNVVGELDGRDEDLVVIGTHHDGPWDSAVEDASGLGLVFAQAAYWAAVPAEERPHRLVFLANAGHMVGGAGCRAFIEHHREELARIVLEVHLEHTAREIVERDGKLIPSGRPEPRWWFTSRIPALEDAVWQAIEAEKLERSLLIPPDVFAPAPTTDGGAFHLAGVPLVNFLTAPFYLFDSIDTMDKIDPDSLVPVTRAAIRIIRSTKGVSADAMRQGLMG